MKKYSIDLQKRLHKCVEEGLCFVSLKPLKNKDYYVYNYELNCNVLVNKEFIKYI